MSYPRRNQKLPEEPRFNPDDGEVSPKYPYITGEVNRLGSEKIRYENPYEPDKAFHASLEVNGSYSINQNHSEDGKEGNYDFSYGEKRSYTSGGASSSSEGSVDRATWGASRDNVMSDKGQSIVGDFHSGVNGQNIGVGQSPSIEHTNNGDSYKSTQGNRTQDHVGHIATNLEGSLTHSISGNYMVMLAKSNNDDQGVGDHGIHIQDGNMDTQVDSGKYRIKAGNDITINSTTKITLVVGDSSIEITPTDITIKAAGNLWLKAVNQVITSGGDSTRIQEGTLDTPAPHPKHNGIG